MKLIKDIGEIFGLCIKLAKVLIRFYLKLVVVAFIFAFIITFITAIASVCHAHDEDGGWFCDTQSSKWSREDGWKVCGVADAITESDAREKALSAAHREFKSNHPAKGFYSIVPGRTDCSKTAGGFHCVRMVQLEYQRPAKRGDPRF